MKKHNMDKVREKLKLITDSNHPDKTKSALLSEFANLLIDRLDNEAGSKNMANHQWIEENFLSD